MKRIASRWLLCSALAALCATWGLAGGTRQALSDTELDAVYAAGFNIQIDFGIDVAASNPDAVVMTGGGTDFLNQGMTLSHTSGGGRNEVRYDPSGSYMPDFQNLQSTNSLNITGNALQNAQSLLNIFALEGDIAVGVNLNVVVNPVDSIFNVSQTNINWSNLGLSDAFTTLF